MAQRNRARNAGVVDAGIAESVPYPVVPAWVSGRFYSGCIHAGALGTVSPSTNTYVVPIVVPNQVIVTSIGVEVSSAGGAGSLFRLAIYTDKNGRPDELVIDAGTVVADATGYQSAVISQVLKAGPYWLALANKTVTSAAAVRALPSTVSHSITAATAMSPSSTSNAYLLIQNNPAAGGIVDTGWMTKIVFGDSNAIMSGAAVSPRIMLGV